LRLIVSKGTVFERDIHESSPNSDSPSRKLPSCAAARFASVIFVSCQPARKTSSG
jgi:hypothetical protein